MQFSAPFISDAQASIAMQPRESSLDGPAPAAQALTRFLPAPCNARAVIADWRMKYNEERPYSALDYRTLKEFVERFFTADSKLVSDKLGEQVKRTASPG